ncbi:protease, partial [Streptomyces sp. AC154]
MDDGKPTEPKAKWWSRPAPGRGTSAAPQEPSPVDDAVPPPDATAVSAGTEADAEPTDSTEPPESVTVEPAPQAAQPLHEPDQYSTPPYG